ncbi:MAG: hypothetical protein HYU84_06595 [Chloroflexi bacterium]|nr:hypothetical protein [Chloroflexota bacterium]
MLSKLLDFIRSEDDLNPSFLRLTKNTLIFVMIINLAVLPLVTGIVGGVQARNILALTVLAAALAVEGISFYFLLQGNVLFAKLIVPIALVVAVTTIAINANGIRDTSFFALPLIIVISAVLLGRTPHTCQPPSASMMQSSFRCWSSPAQVLLTC